jgi:hypothetical protein
MSATLGHAPHLAGSPRRWKCRTSRLGHDRIAHPVRGHDDQRKAGAFGLAEEDGQVIPFDPHAVVSVG